MPVPPANNITLAGTISCSINPLPRGLLILTSPLKIPYKNTLVNYPLSYFFIKSGNVNIGCDVVAWLEYLTSINSLKFEPNLSNNFCVGA